MRILFSTVFLIICSCYANLNAQENWKEIKSIENLCTAYPDAVKGMISEYDLNYPGLEKVKSSISENDLPAACKFLLEYYRGKTKAPDLPEISGKKDEAADTILNNVFVIQNVRGQLPILSNGHRDWYYKGPRNDREWAWLSNRHSQLGRVFSAYLSTGNPVYADYVDLFLRDFILSSMPYPKAKGSGSIWRGLEVAARAKMWTRIFYTSLFIDYISPAAQLLILSSLPDHAHYNRNFHGGGNWLTMELSALATIATNFPEYKNSEEWLDYSIGVMQESMKEQVYPDGVQNELTSHYHRVARSNFDLFRSICEKANRNMPDSYNKLLEKMYAYTAFTLRPDGAGILNNDGDRTYNRESVLEAARRHNNEEWEYIATNGESGKRPAEMSYVFPWAGQIISRSGFDQNAHWSFFDIGPWGSGHQHQDKLHISLSAYGRDLLVDAGRFAYTGEVREKFGRYARGSEGHNIILIDGKGQMAGPRIAKMPVPPAAYKINKAFDFACGSFDNYIGQTGKVEHSRSLFYVRGKFWLIADRITTNQPREIDILWHWHPKCKVLSENQMVRTNNETGNLAVIPVGKQEFDVSLVKGQELPDIQGWYSPEYNIFEPNVASIYSTGISENTTFVWLLLPSEKNTPEVEAKIIYQDNDVVKVEVKSTEEKIHVTIPYFDNQKAGIVSF